MKYLISPRAHDDLFAIWSYIAEDSEEAADRVQADFYRAFAALARMPGQGHRRLELADSTLLFFPKYSYLIIYRAVSPLEIVAVISVIAM